jgi:hypothetical protein
MEGAVEADMTLVTDGMTVRTADLERLCRERDPRCVEFACFLLHSSGGDAELAAHRAIDGLFDDPPIRAMQRETALCVRDVAVAALDLRVTEAIERSIRKCWPVSPADRVGDEAAPRPLSRAGDAG